MIFLHFTGNIGNLEFRLEKSSSRKYEPSGKCKNVNSNSNRLATGNFNSQFRDSHSFYSQTLQQIKIRGLMWFSAGIKDDTTAISASHCSF